MNDPIYCLSNSFNGSILLHYAKCIFPKNNSITSCVTIMKTLKTLFISRSLINQSDRDAVLMDSHSFRLRIDIHNDFLVLLLIMCHRLLKLSLKCYVRSGYAN